MFQNITWAQYWMFIVLSTTVYYFVVFILYFKTARFSLPLNLTVTRSSAFQKKRQWVTEENNNIEGAFAESCMDELNAFFDNQKKSKAVKSEILDSLKIILQKYPLIKISGYKESLSNLIATQCKSVCSIHLSSDELKDVWLG